MLYNERWHLCDFELLVQYTGNKRPNLERFFAFSNSPVGGIGNVHKKIEIILSKTLKNDKIRLFRRKVCLIWFSRSGDGENLVEILVYLASRDVSEGYIHRKFDVSSLETKIEHCPDAQLAILSKKPTL